MTAIGTVKEQIKLEQIKTDAYSSMQGLGKGAPATLRDVFLIDDEYNLVIIIEGKL